MLFFDARLSRDGNVSCATCHDPAKAMSIGAVAGVGSSGVHGTRNPPALVAVGNHSRFFWDGRSSDLESAVLRAFVNPHEHALESFDELLQRVASNREYRNVWAAISDGSADIDLAAIAIALADYIRASASRPTRFDRFWFHGDESALSAEERRGLELFKGAARCSSCHSLTTSAAPFSDDDFHPAPETTPIGAIGEALSRLEGLDPARTEALATLDPAVSALGRYLVTRRLQDVGRFRTPTLREVARTAPYFHDGSVATLEQAVAMELYLHRHEGRVVEISQDERAALVAFLRSLSAESEASR